MRIFGHIYLDIYTGVLISLDQIKNYGQSKVESDIKRNLMQLRLNIKRKELLQKKSIADW